MGKRYHFFILAYKSSPLTQAKRIYTSEKCIQSQDISWVEILALEKITKAQK